MLSPRSPSVVCATFVLLQVFSNFGGGDCRGVPFTPCSKLFNYFESETWEIFGAMTFKNDFSGEYHLVVNMSIPTDTDKNIKIWRRTSEHRIKNGENIEYYVTFPFNHTFPLLTSVVFNGKTYCTGPGAEKTADHGVTELSARNDLSTKINEGALELYQASLPRPPPPRPSSQPVDESGVFNRIPEDVYGGFVCGEAEDYKQLVVNGNATKSGEYPWLVAMYYLQGSGDYKFKCAANLVTKRHVITAAHCLRYYKVDIVTVEDILLVLGKHNIRHWATKSVIRDVKRMFVHPEFLQPGDADVAVLEMTQPVDYSPTVRPICLWNETDGLGRIIGDKGTVVGWGKDENGNEYVNEPKQVLLPVVSQEDCLRADDRFLKLTSKRTFCAGRLDGSSPCTGDSGGGFVFRRQGKWTLRGLVSVSLRDEITNSCDTKNFVVFSDVTKFIPWVLDKINGKAR